MSAVNHFPFGRPILGREVVNKETPVTTEKLVKKIVTRAKKKTTVVDLKKNRQLELFDGLNATAQNNETIAFNKQILKAKREGIVNRAIYSLGYSKEELKKIIGRKKISITGEVFDKTMIKDKNHCMTFENYINLPDNINSPSAIFKSKKANSYVVLTEIKNTLNKPLMVAIEINDLVKINKISSIYSRTSLKHYKSWIDLGLLLYKNEKSVLFQQIMATIANERNKTPLKSGDLPKVAVASPKDGDKKPLSKNKDTKKGLNCPNIPKKEKVTPEPVAKTPENMDKNSLAYKMANQPKDVEYFTIPDANISRLLGKIEKKTKESVFVSLTGGEGSMKTRMAFQFMNAFGQNYKVGHASIEEHPESVLYFDKAKQYLDTKAQGNITNPEVNSLDSLHKLILKNDVIVIDSFTKMKEIEKSFEVDRDLRKKYNGKLFIVIFQQTTDGSMRGGSKSQFDADAVLFTEKFDNYKQNYVYATKNRYSSETGLKFNIYSKQLQGAKNKERPGTEVQAKTKKLSFKVK